MSRSRRKIPRSKLLHVGDYVSLRSTGGLTAKSGAKLVSVKLSQDAAARTLNGARRASSCEGTTDIVSYRSKLSVTMRGSLKTLPRIQEQLVRFGATISQSGAGAERKLVGTEAIGTVTFTVQCATDACVRWLQCHAWTISVRELQTGLPGSGSGAFCPRPKRKVQKIRDGKRAPYSYNGIGSR